jgi:hypothetical protein
MILLPALWFLVGLLSDPQVESHVFLRNGGPSHNYMTLQPKALFISVIFRVVVFVAAAAAHTVRGQVCLTPNFVDLSPT